MVKVIISGGQSGADLGGLRAGIRLGIPTGGYMPKGWKTEYGPKPEYEQLYDMTEWNTEDYVARTKQNVFTSNATVIFGRRSPGSNRTEEFCRVLDKPCMWVTPIIPRITGRIAYGRSIFLFQAWIDLHTPHILNVAGNRESVYPGLCDYVEQYLVGAMS